LSLDAVAEAPDRFLTAWDDQTDAGRIDLIAAQDAVLLGRIAQAEGAVRGTRLCVAGFGHVAA
jgi:hypothetical protein